MPSSFHVVISDFLGDASVESPVLDGLASVSVAKGRGEEDLAEHLAEADALIVYHDITMLSDSSFALAPRCRGIIRAGVGFNNVDIVAAGRRGIVVCNVPDYGTE